MELTDEQIDFIRGDLCRRGITLPGLADSLVDHICCSIENNTSATFGEAYQRALEGFGENGLKQVQHETLLIITLKKEVTMKRTMYLIGYIAVFLSTTGLLFKLQHWPGAAIMLVFGIALLNFGFLPMYFYDRYKKAIS